MCSIIGYSGNEIAAPIIVKGLKRMEYRGYDSVGVATESDNQIELKKGINMFLVGSFLILVANIIRIDILAYLLVKNNVNLFLTLHMLTWKLLSGIYVAFVWIFLVKKYDVKGIPLISDFKYLKKKSLF